MQITSGVLRLLSIPFVYELFQWLMGAKQSRRLFVMKFVEPYNVENVLDIGCGPAAILDHLPGIDYYGFDISKAYIAKAYARFGDKGHFFNKILDETDVEYLPKFDLVLMKGLLHHLDDAQAITLMHLAFQTLKKGGRVITEDGCLVPGQNTIARWLINHDRGQNIRDEEGYLRLANHAFTRVESSIEHKTWIPYTLCHMQCKR